MLPMISNTQEDVATPKPCQDCETLASPVPKSGMLYLCPADDELLVSLTELKLLFLRVMPGVVSLPITNELFPLLAAHRADWGIVRAAIVPEGIEPTMAALMTSVHLMTLLKQVEGEWLRDLLRDQRLTTHFQPIVLANSPAVVHGYECLTRGRETDGTLIPPNKLFRTARETGLLYVLDKSARVSAVSHSAKLIPSAKIFINFMPSAIYNPETCLRTTFRAAELAGIDPKRIVFEVVESEEVRDTEHLLNLLLEYRKAGFQVALDDVGAGYSSLKLLTKLRPDYIKIDMELIRNISEDRYKAQVVAKLLEMAHSLGIQTIAEGIESRKEWNWLKKHKVHFVQGYLFAKPEQRPPIPQVPAGWSVE